MQRFLGDPKSGLLNLEAHHLTLAIAKKTLDENRFRTAQKTTEKHHHSRSMIEFTSRTCSQESGT